jgi:ssRNA-specific RNase YbeY (16S rRNA maturation enzyme)
MNSDGSSLLFRHPASGVRRTPLREFLAELERRVTRGKSFDCLVSDDRELRALNRQFRGKNQTTDVLSFRTL